MSVEQAEILTRRYAKTLGAIIDQADQAISHFGTVTQKVDEVPSSTEVVSDDQDTSDRDMSDNTQACDDSSSTSGSLLVSDAVDRPGKLIKPQDYSGIVKECVNEVLQQMFKVNELERYMEKLEKVTEMVDRKLENVSSMKNIEPQLRELTTSDESEDPYTASKEKTRSAAAVSGILKALWSPLLDVADSKIKADDSFFELGGDSILAMELARSAREASMTLTVADIFNFPNLSDMANLITTSTQKKEQQMKEAKAAKVKDAALIIDRKHLARFTLIKAANTDSFIQDYICPKVGVFRTGIADAFPVTDFQALAIAGSLLKERWMVNFFTFDGTGSLDLNILRKAASTLIQHFDILRTVFIASGNSFLQVVLRSLRPQIMTHETDMGLDDFTRKLRYENPAAYPKLGEPCTQFLVVKKMNSNAHRIIIRVSHAQYDGVSLPKIIEAFQAAYEGRSITPPPPFSNYIAEAAAGSNTHGQYDYWRTLLEGSSMTHIVDRDQPKYTGTDLPTTVLKKTITLASLTSRKITTATVLKAAWAVVLAQLCSSTDIVFGNLISGRNAGVDGVESIVGPCLNIIPVRIQLEPAKWTALDLLRRVQSQLVSGMSFESLGFREMIQKCTDWPAWTYFSSIVQHQNLAEAVTLKLDRKEYTVGFQGTNDTLADMHVCSTPKGGDEVEVTLGFVEGAEIPTSVAQSALDALCILAQGLAKNPNGKLDAAMEAVSAGIEMLPPTVVPPRALHGAQEEALTAALRAIPRQQLHTLADTLTRAWRIVLPSPRALGEHGNNDGTRAPQPRLPTSLTLSSSFYDQGGDLVALASLTSILEQEGYVVTIEELVARPSVGAQVAFLWERSAGESKKVEKVEQDKEKVEADERKLKAGKKKGFWRKLLGGKKAQSAET